jgi:hypothetical protein
MNMFQRLVIYNLLLFLVFSWINYALKNDFAYISEDPKNWVSLAWYTFSNHTATGSGDIYPTTNRARLLSIAHLSLALAGSTFILLGTKAALT